MKNKFIDKLKKTSNIMIQKLFFTLILSSSSEVLPEDKIQYIFKLIVTFGPVAFVLNEINVWFDNNAQFFSFIIITLMINIFSGVWYHRRMKTFEWSEFFKKNLIMWASILLAYPILEFISIIAGKNIVGEFFKATIQIATILYPASKIFKNIYFLSNEQFPPKFIMQRIYNFEKTGNVNEIFKPENNESHDDTTSEV